MRVEDAFVDGEVGSEGTFGDAALGWVGGGRRAEHYGKRVDDGGV